MVKEELGSLIGTGIALGVVHVLTGPDHLSALATLSANESRLSSAASLGIRWGLGHSSGLLLVGIVLIAVSHAGQESVDMPDALSHFFESVVGVFMLLLGSYGVRRAWLKRPNSFYNVLGSEASPTKDIMERVVGDNNEMEEGNEEEEEGQQPEGLFTIGSNDSSYGAANSPNNNNAAAAVPGRNLEIYFDGDETPSSLQSPVFHDDNRNSNVFTMDSEESDLEGAVAVVEQAYLDTVSPSRFRRFMNNITRRLSTKTLAFCIGIVHGLAGPGGVLGVIPAVQLQNWKLATVYLTCFCVSSTCTMGCFATMYGVCSSRLVGNGADTRREFQIECFSACLSILVGITWLTLLAMGKLEDVFP